MSTQQKGKKLFFMAGEQSGDLHGGKLIGTLLANDSSLQITAIAGPEMRKHPIDVLMPMEEFQVMGITPVLMKLPKLAKQFRQIRDFILEEQPDVVVLIDYPGLNLRLAKSLRKHGYTGKIVQYISPSVWAHGTHRIKTMADNLDMLLVIFPFEPKCYDGTDLRVEYVGNPIVESVRSHHYNDSWTQEVGINDTENLVAIFPGSRFGEIDRNFALELETCKLLQDARPEVHFAISCANEKLEDKIRTVLAEAKIKPQGEIPIIPAKYSYELMRDCRSALAVTGTVAIELGLHKKPTVPVYSLAWINRFFARFILRVKINYFCMVNIMNDKEVFPEFMEKVFRPYPAFVKLEELTFDETARDRCRRGCEEMIQALQYNKVSETAAKHIEEMLHEAKDPAEAAQV